MTAEDTRAKDVLARLRDCKLAGDLESRDLESKDCSEAFCKAAISLAVSIAAISRLDAEADQSQLQGGTNAVKRSGSSPQEAAGGRLDNALKRLDRALEGTSKEQDRLVILERLISYLQAVRLMAAPTSAAAGEQSSKPDEAEQRTGAEDSMEGIGGDAALASSLIRDMASRLNVPSSFSSHSAIKLLEGIDHRLQDVMAALPQSFLAPILPEGSLSDEQVQVARDIHQGLQDEYTLRRRMLTERVKVTLDSLLRSNQLQERGTLDEARRVAEQGSARMTAEPLVPFDSIFQACQADLVPVSAKATSGDKGKFEASVKSVLIGKVPDRGGRPYEGRAAAAAASMPAWASRQSDGGGGSASGGRGGGARGRGKRHRGGH